MPAERVLLKHPVEGRVELAVGHLPGHQRAVGEVRGQKRLAHPADVPRHQHGADALDDRLQRYAGEPGDLPEWIALNGSVNSTGTVIELVYKGFWPTRNSDLRGIGPGFRVPRSESCLLLLVQAARRPISLACDS